MGKDTKGDRKATKPSSSARAAEVLANKAGGAGGFGFGGFTGGSPIGPNVPGFGFGAAAAARIAASSATVSGAAAAAGDADAAGGSDAPLTAQVDGELAQCIRHLSKKDATTKTKALQNLRALIPGRPTNDIVTAFPPWIYMYRRLILDPSRAVRSETAATLACLLTALGKAVAPHLKGLMGPWYLAMYDPYGDAAAGSRNAFAAAFPAGRRQVDVVLYCRSELMSYLKDQLAATPHQLGDPKKDSPEELEERHERVQAACLSALAALIDLMTVPPADDAGGGGNAAAAAPAGKDELLAAIRDMLCRPGFWKGTAGAKSATVRRASYGLARYAAQRAPELLSGCAAESAVCVLGALGEKEPANHGAMWEAVLTYGKFCPDGWCHVSMRKMLLPRLYSLLRHCCYGSAATSLPALLPLLPLLPAGMLGPAPDVLVTVLDNLWLGSQDPAVAARPAKAACMTAYRECLGWGLTTSARLVAAAAAVGGSGGGGAAAATAAPPGDPADYCRSLLAGSLVHHVLPAALSPGAQGEAAADLVAELAQTLAAAADRAAAAAAATTAVADAPAAGSIALVCLTDATRQFVSDALAKSVAAAVAAGSGADDGESGRGELAAACEGTAALLARLRRGGATSYPDVVSQVAAAAAQGLMSAGPGGLPAAASQLLATLLREYGTGLSLTLSPAPGGALAGGAATAAESGAEAVAAAAAPSDAVAGAAGGAAGSGSFSLDSLVASYNAGTASGPSAEATADLLVAFCHSHVDSSALWDQVLTAVLPADSDRTAAPATQQAKKLLLQHPQLQRALLLLHRGAESVKGTGEAGAAPEALGWTCASLDTLAVRLAQGLFEGGVYPQADQQPAIDLLSAALGANAAGQLMLRPAAAADVLGSLTGHLAAALGSREDAAGAGAGVSALAALEGPLCDGRCGLWRVLPEQACEALAAAAQLGWQAPQASYSRAAAARGRRGGRGSSDGGGNEGGDGEVEDDEDESEAAESESADGDEGDEGESGSPGHAATASRVVRCAADRLWRKGNPLAAAAAALPTARTDALVRHLAGLLAGAVPAGGSAAAAGGGADGLSARAWAANAAQLLQVAPGGVEQRQVALEALLAARPEWRSFSSLTAGSAAPSTSTSAPSSSSAAAAASAALVVPPRAEPSLEYLARLAEAAGPRMLLGAAYDSSGAGELEAAESREGSGGSAAAGAAGPGRCWVLVELLCGHHAATGGAAADVSDDDEEEEEEEDDDDGANSRAGASGGRNQAAVSETWRRVVGREAEEMLGHVVYGSVDEVAAGEATGGSGGLYGSLLQSLVDELADGCRGGGAVAEAASPANVADAHEPLPPTQTVFLEALCQVASLTERASPCGEPGDTSGAAQPPLLPHQQRLCRHWLSTCRPDAATSSGLPPQALLRLLPLAAGPVRRAAAAAAMAYGTGGGGAAAAEALLAASGLPELSCSWMRHCMLRPSVLVEPSGPAVAALALAAECFPVPGTRGGGSSSGGASAAAALTLARSAGAGLAESERPLLMQLVRHQLVRHAGTAAARRQQGDAAAPDAAASSSAPSPAVAPSWPQAADAARAAATRLSHAAVVYNWKGLGQPDWHALLQDVQDHLAGAVAALAACLGQLAAAARTAADGVLQQPPGTTPAGPMALQLLRKLGQRGVLARVPQGRALELGAEAALAECGIGPAAEAAAQLAAVLMDLQDEVAAAAGGGSASGAAAASREYGNTVAACCSHVLQLAIELGGVECYGAAFGLGAAAAVAAWLDEHRAFWAAVTRCAGRALVPGHEHLGAQASATAVAAQTPALEQAGLDAVGSLLAVALTPGSHLLQPVAYRLLLGDALLGRVTLADAVGAAGGGGGGGSEVELPEYDGDDVAYLTAGGVRPEMAPWLLPAAAAGGGGGAAHGGSTRVYLTAWALLLAHALELEAGSRGLMVLRQVLREAGQLVYGLLGQVVPELGLQKQQAQQARGAGGSGAGGGGGGRRGAAAAAASAAPDVDSWRLAEALREIGLPSGAHAVRATCRTLYRAVLRALPATARGWFSDLRDRGLAAAVESYTAATEGPALLAAEMAAVQALSRRASAGDDKFTVRASAVAREVVAVLEVEDGAVLELVVKLPACLPLRPPDIECRRKVGVNETRLRKWLLSIDTFLRHQNGSVADAIGLWKRNVDSEFEGVEACIICYSVISSVNAQLPRLVCRTCNVRFHPACLYKWFKSAGKSQCPHCQALW